MTLDQFITKYQGKYVEYHSYSANALNQCADLANQYIVEVLGLTAIIGTNAQDFPSKKGTQFDYILNTPTGVPQKGDLMIFKSADKVGHISIFVSGDANSFKSFDQNYPTGSPCKIVIHNYTNVLGWMRKKGTMADIIVDSKTYEMLVTKASKLDEIEKTRYITIPEHNNIIAQKDRDISLLQKQITDHTCPTVQTVDMSKWEINGLQVQEGNKTFNYKLK